MLMSNERKWREENESRKRKEKSSRRRKECKTTLNLDKPIKSSDLPTAAKSYMRENQ